MSFARNNKADLTPILIFADSINHFCPSKHSLHSHQTHSLASEYRLTGLYTVEQFISFSPAFTETDINSWMLMR